MIAEIAFAIETRINWWPGFHSRAEFFLTRSTNWRAFRDVRPLLEYIAPSILLLLALLPTGCRHGPKPSTADPAKAREILKQGLEAWKKGDSLDSFQTSSSVTFNDPQWKKGLKLVKYEVNGDGQSAGHDWQCKVTLTVKDKSEKTEKATYIISTAPKQVVTRSDMK